MTPPETHKVGRIRQHYAKRVTPDRENFDILDWGCREAQLARFDVLLKELSSVASASGPVTVLDVGCGMTDLASYLAENDVQANYVGADITWEILHEASRRYPDRALVQADMFSAPCFPEKSFNVAYCSGVFNLRLGNNADFALRAIPQLVAQADSLIVANFLHIRTRKKYPHCFYFDPDILLRKLQLICRQIHVVDDYLENDFSLVIRP